MSSVEHSSEHSFEIDQGDAVPGHGKSAGEEIRAYFMGLVLAVLLTGASFFCAGTNLIWGPAIPAALIALAVAQIGVHLVFFLHITTSPDNTNNVLALAFGILIVFLLVGGSVWIMQHLNHNLMPMQQMLRMQH